LIFYSDGNSLEDEDFSEFAHLGNSDNYLTTTQRIRDDQIEKEILEKRQKSEELQAFLEDQVAQVFQTYLRDYFQRETALLRSIW
jgi:hypothetical protein